LRIFAPLYDRALLWAADRRAPRYLGALSFAESSFFPVPPDVMLIPMSAARPERAMYFALLTTLTSVLGGVAGYLIGFLAFEAIEPWVVQVGYGDALERAKAAFEQWGVWIIFIAGFSPIPYKIFTLSAGALAMPFLPFVLASIIGRGGRFFLVAALVRWLGPGMLPTVRRYVESLGWASVVLIALLVVVLKWPGA
jgi:membrane protein YqaA with SNARE-associated domain